MASRGQIDSEVSNKKRWEADAEQDKVYTPDVVVLDCMRVMEPLIASGDVLLDPFLGKGAFYNRFPATNVKDWDEIEKGRDFFERKEERSVDWIVSNPPYSTGRGRLFERVLRHSCTLCRKGFGYLIYAYKLTAARLQAVAEKGFDVARLCLCQIYQGGWGGRPVAFVVFMRSVLWSPFCYPMENVLGRGETNIQCRSNENIKPVVFERMVSCVNPSPTDVLVDARPVAGSTLRFGQFFPKGRACSNLEEFGRERDVDWAFSYEVCAFKNSFLDFREFVRASCRVVRKGICVIVDISRLRKFLFSETSAAGLVLVKLWGFHNENVTSTICYGAVFSKEPGLRPVLSLPYKVYQGKQ